MGFRELNINLTLDTTGFTKAINKVASQMNQLGSRFEGSGRDLTTRLTVPMGLFGAAAVKAFSDFEKSAKALEAVTGSAKLTAEQIDRLREVAKLPGLGFEQSVRASARLQAVGLSAKEAEEAIKQFGNAVARSGGGAVEFDGAILALTQIASKGKISAEEINQLNERIFEIRPALKAAFGTSDSEQLEKLGVSAEEFIARTTEELGKLARVQGGLGNSFENFSDSVRSSLAALGESISKSIDLEGIMNKLANSVGDVAQYFKGLSPETQRFLVTAGAIAASIGPILIGLGSLLKLLPLLRAGFLAFTGPIGLTIAALATLVALLTQVDLKKSIIGGTNVDAAIFGGNKSALRTTQDEQRGASALAFAGVGPKGKAANIPVGVIAPSVTANIDKYVAALTKATGATTEFTKASRPLIELATLNGSAFGTLAEQVDFSNIALLKSTTATDAAAGSIEQLQANTAAWQEQLAMGLPMQIDQAIALEATNERLAQQQQRFQEIADIVGTTLQDAFSGFFDTLLSGGKNAFRAFGEAIKVLVKKLLTAVATALALSAVFSLITGGAGSALSLLGGSGSGFGGLFKTLLKGGLGFAQGGLVYGPVSALIGEGPGTSRTNPEVVAPLDKLQGILQQSQAGAGFLATTRISGDDLLILVERAEKNRAR